MLNVKLVKEKIVEKIALLPKTKQKNGYNYTLVKRTDNVAMYSQTDPEFDKIVSYEVFRIIRTNACVLKDKKNPDKIYNYPPSEKFPGNEDFGKTAWTYTTRESADEVFQKLENESSQ